MDNIKINVRNIFNLNVNIAGRDLISIGGKGEKQHREEAMEMCKEIGYCLLQDNQWKEDRKKEFALGYGNAQQLIAFYYNTPTCTLPIFWKEGMYNGKKWIPLFLRRE